jgi:hypothetical protein
VNWNFNVQGNRRNTNNLTIDGATVNAIGKQLQLSGGGVDGCGGRGEGAAVELPGRVWAHVGGERFDRDQVRQQEFHGLASYYKRNEALNANDFFNNRLGGRRPRYRFDTWNYNAGGPVMLPGGRRFKDKMFFFWSQEFWPPRCRRR